MGAGTRAGNGTKTDRVEEGRDSSRTCKVIVEVGGKMR